MENIPTPSLISKELASKLRLTLLILLIIDLFYYIFGSFGSLGDISAVDLLLLFIGYYGQDLFRISSLKLYFILSIGSALVDCIVVIVRSIILSKNGFVWLVIILNILFLLETVAKIFSIIFSRRLYLHLISVPGQSVQA